MANLSVSWRNAGVAHIALRRGATAPNLGAAWPTANGLSESVEIVLANVAPDAALAVSATDNVQWLESLHRSTDDKTTVTDQSGAYRILRLEGTGARDLLASGVFIDLDPDAFPAGRTAALRCGHIAVVLLHRADTAFEILVPRSYADSFLHWLRASATMRNLSLIGI